MTPRQNLTPIYVWLTSTCRSIGFSTLHSSHFLTKAVALAYVYARKGVSDVG